MAGRRGRTSPPGSGAELRAGLGRSGLSLHQLWIAYLIAQALNDHFVSAGQNHPVAYAGELHAEHVTGQTDEH